MVDNITNMVDRVYQSASGQGSAILNNADTASFYKELNSIMSETSDSPVMDDTEFSELPASCSCELCRTDGTASQDEDGETEEVGDEVIFDIFDHFEACLECEDRENCKHYLAMTGASEEEIEKADIIVKSPFDKYKDFANGQLSRSLRTSIIYNYSIICPEIEKKPKRDK